MNYEILKMELLNGGYASMNSQEAASYLNNVNIPTLKKVKYTDVASYLSVAGKFLAITESTKDSAKMYRLAAATFTTFDLSKPFVNTVIEGSLKNLVDDNLLSDTNKAAILNLAGAGSISRAAQLGLNHVSEAQVTTARES